MANFKVKLNGKLLDGTFTPEEIGENLVSLLRAGATFGDPQACNPTIAIKMVKKKTTKKK